MPSRRRVLAGGGLGLAGVVGSVRFVERPIPLDHEVESAIDWPMPRYDPAGTGANPDATGPREDPTIRWERDLRDLQGPMPAPPTLYGDAVFVVGRSSLYALEREDGRIRFERTGYSYLSSPTVASADAYRSPTLAVRGNEGVLGLSASGGYALAGRGIGLERWYGPGEEPPTRTFANPVPPSPVAADGTVYAALPDLDRLVAVDASSGRLEWSYEPDLVWPGEPNRPAVRDGTVYATFRPDVVAAIDAGTGDVHWEIELEPAEPEDEHDYRELVAPTATEAGLVVPSRRAVSLLDPADGSRIWEYEHGGRVTDGSVAVADGTVFAPDGRDDLHAIDLETGQEVWTTEYGLDAHPVVAGDVIYLTYSWLDDLIAVDVENGERLWEREIGAGPSQPIVGDGVLYFAGHEGVTALEDGGDGGDGGGGE